MLTLSDILKPRYVDLALGPGDVATGIKKLARRLEGDAGMLNWAAFQAELKMVGNTVGAQALLSHVRTDYVSTMLMAAGRMPAEAGGVHFLFLVAVPKTLASEYLRMVGALARSLRNPAIVMALRETDSVEDFVRILCAEAAGM